MKVGIPRALLFYYYYPFWQTFFEEMGIEVITTPSTSREIVDVGVRYSVAEICVPIKVFCGHVAVLLESDVDYIFIPRMVTVEQDKHFCPKFMGLPDMMQFLLPGLKPRLLAPDVRSKNEALLELDDYEEFSKTLGVTKAQIKHALKVAKTRWEVFRGYHRKGHTIDEAVALLKGATPQQGAAASRTDRLKIGLLGYVYNIYDSFVGMDVIKRLRAMGADVVTFEMLDDEAIVNKLRPMHKTLPWTFSNKLLGAGYSLFDDPEIDGLMHVTAFGCGPDSMLGRMLEFSSSETGKPFMTVRVDEHTGEAHMATRLEAFIDMLRRKKFPA